MAYRYETHMHTMEGSACSSSTGAEMARAHKAAGYTGIFVTDHFFSLKNEKYIQYSFVFQTLN